MYRNTRFGELMKAFPRAMFDRAVKDHKADKYSKGFRSRDQVTAMIYGQLAGCRSLRELEVAFNSHSAHHYHLGTRSIKRSTLADANAKRDEGLYQAVCQHLLQEVGGRVRREIDSMLYLLDSTPIPLKGLGYDAWASEKRSNRTQGLKLHMLYCPEHAVPVYSQISAPNVNDIEDARRLGIEPGATYVFDKGYYDYSWWHRLNEENAVFVTRFKHNAALHRVEPLAIPSADAGHILADERVSFKYRHPGGKRYNPYKKPLRRIVVAREGKKPMTLATNDFTRSAAQIADLYKTRWQIELFFKWLKQNLKIKRFFGRTENAVRTQVYIALITYILVWFYRLRQGFTGSLTQCTVLLSAALFQRPATEYQLWRRRKRREEELLARQRVLL